MKSREQYLSFVQFLITFPQHVIVIDFTDIFRPFSQQVGPYIAFTMFTVWICWVSAQFMYNAFCPLSFSYTHTLTHKLIHSFSWSLSRFLTLSPLSFFPISTQKRTHTWMIFTSAGNQISFFNFFFFVCQKNFSV